MNCLNIMLNRFQKRIVSILALFALVFAQLTVSAYACPMLFEAAQVETCSDDSTPMNAALCQPHCQNDQQNVGDHVTPTDRVQFVAIFSVELPTLVSPQSQAAPQERLLVAPCTPPPRLAFSRLLV